MAYSVFISHSTRDQGLVIALARILSQFGVDVSVAEWYLTPGQRLDNKVFRKIETADCTIVLLTANGARSNWVQQEIGYALKTNPERVIPIVERGISQQDLAALEGKEYIEYDTYRPEMALLKASSYIKSLKLQKEEQEKALLVAGGILAFLLLLSRSGERK